MPLPDRPGLQARSYSPALSATVSLLPALGPMLPTSPTTRSPGAYTRNSVTWLPTLEMANVCVPLMNVVDAATQAVSDAFTLTPDEPEGPRGGLEQATPPTTKTDPTPA